MSERKLTNPLIVVHRNPADIYTPDGGGGSKKVFGDVGPATRGRLSDQLQAVSAHFDSFFRRSATLPGVAKIILKEEALAKTHRPVSLLQTARCPIVGVGSIGELLISVNMESLRRLQNVISNVDSKQGIANLSTIEEILPYRQEDVLGSLEYEALLESVRSTGGRLKYKLFQHRDSARDHELQINFQELLVQLQLGHPRVITYGRHLKVLDIEINNEDQLRGLTQFIGTKSVSHFPMYRFLKSKAVPVRPFAPGEFPVPDTSLVYPIMGIVDSGINPSDVHIAPWVVETHNYIPAGIPHDYSHGSFVAGLSIASRSLNHGDPRFPKTSTRVVDVAALPDSGISEDELTAVLEEVIPKHPEVKVWNLSLSTDEPCRSDQFSDLAVSLDELQDKYDVTFVLAAGNYEMSPLRAWPSQPLGEADRVSTPGDSARALTVGSLAHAAVSSSLVKRGEPSPFSRRGPGPVFIPKPELTHFGGNCDGFGRCSQVGVLSLDGRGNLAEDIGTSFSTPIVSSILANVKHHLGPTPSRNLAKALLIHSAATGMSNLTAEDLKYFGFGVPLEVENVFGCADWEATSIFELELLAGVEFAKDFPIPPSLLTPDGKTLGEFTVTLVYDPPLDPTFGSEYCRSNVDVSLGTYELGADGKRHHNKKIPLNPLDISELYESRQIEHGFKWSPVKVYKRVIPNGVQGVNWRLKVSVQYRSLFKTNDPQKIAVIVTAADPERRRPVYSEFINSIRQQGWSTSTLQLAQRQSLRT